MIGNAEPALRWARGPEQDATVGAPRHLGDSATPSASTHVVDDVAIGASSVGLALQCLICRTRELVTLDELCFNQRVRRFLFEHPSGCAPR